MFFLQQSSSILGSVLNEFASSLPNIVGAILVLLIGWLIAKFASKLIKKGLIAANVDKLGDHFNNMDIVESMSVKVVLSSIISAIAYYILILLSLAAATDVLGMPVISNLVSDFINYIPKLLSALLFFGVGLLLADFIRNIVQTACESLGVPSAKIIAGFIFYFLLITVSISAIDQAGVDTDFIKSNLTIVLAGGVLAFGVGYGFASRHVLANFLASFYSKDKLNIGDKIKIEGNEGEIIAIDGNSVTLQLNNKRIIIPMSRFSEKEVEIYDKP